MLKKINEAYEVLSDAAKRDEYDLFTGVQRRPFHYNKQKAQEPADTSITDAIIKEYLHNKRQRDHASGSLARKLQTNIFSRTVSLCIGIWYILNAYIILIDTGLVTIVVVYVAAGIYFTWYSEEAADHLPSVPGTLVWCMGWLYLMGPFLLFLFFKYGFR